MIPGAIKMLTFLTRAGLRQTKRLSAFKSMGKTEKIIYKLPKKAIAGKQLRPWATGLIGEKGLLKKVGLSATKRRQALYGYQRGYKHVAKHKKLYGAGVAGAAIWDFLPGKDNPKA
jgi:hypothetical protein